VGVAHPQVLAQEVRQPVAGARPRLDLELEQVGVARLAADLPGLDVAPMLWLIGDALERRERRRRR
jgi:hypothetical protein